MRRNVDLHPRFEYGSEPCLQRFVHIRRLAVVDNETEIDAQGSQRASLVHRKEGVVQPPPVEELLREEGIAPKQIDSEANGYEGGRSDA